MSPEERATRIAIDLPIAMPQGMFRVAVLRLAEEIRAAENEAYEDAATVCDARELPLEAEIIRRLKHPPSDTKGAA